MVIDSMTFKTWGISRLLMKHEGGGKDGSRLIILTQSDLPTLVCGSIMSTKGAFSTGFSSMLHNCNILSLAVTVEDDITEN